MLRRNKTFIIYLTLIFSLLSSPVCYSSHQADCRTDGGYFTVIDENGNVIFQTGLEVNIGDEYLNAENMLYRVTAVQGDSATARFIRKENVSLEGLSTANAPPSIWHEKIDGRIFSIAKTVQAQSQGPVKVAFYHSHSDESYVPSDGSESIRGNGGIYKVGAALSLALNKNNITPIHDYSKHDPHDDAAYDRSRPTAINLLKQNPAVLFDIHRDAVPPEVYETVVAGQYVTKINIVVGKENPNMQANREFALQLKAAVDQTHPGLIKGIFFASGGYNQDLSPRALLLEVGAHTNYREDAEKGIALLSDALPRIIGTNPQPGVKGTGPVQPPNKGFSGGIIKSLGIILGLAIFGGAAFLFVSTENWQETREKLRRLLKSEFTNSLGWKKTNKNNKGNHEEN